MLVKAALEDLAANHGGFFIMGKFDQLQIPQPYAPFVTILMELIVQLAEAQDGQDKLRLFRERISSDIGEESLHVLRALVPNWRRVFGECTEEFGCVGRECLQDRLKVAFCRFVHSVCSVSQPIVLVLDDLQWADIGSLDLLESLLLEEGIEGLVLVTICRCEEVSVTHNFAGVLRRLEDSKMAQITHIQVSNMSLKATSCLVASVLRETSGSCQPFAEIIHSKSSGNVFYMMYLIKALYEEGVLLPGLSTEKKSPRLQWIWNDRKWDEISRTDLSLLTLVSRQVKRQPVPSQRLLRMAAFIGAEFDIDMLRTLLGDVDISESLKPLVKEGLIVQRMHQSSKYAFSHDQIQILVFSLTPENEKAAEHLSIGRTLYQQMSSQEFKNNIFLVVNQMVRGSKLLQLETDKYGLASLCLLAGKRATRSSDFVTAVTYYKIGRSLFGQRHWRDEYQLSLDLFSSLAEAACCISDFDTVDDTIGSILTNALSFCDKLRGYTTKIYSLGARRNLREALDLGKEVLTGLGEKLPAKPGVRHFLVELVGVNWRLRGKSDADLLGLPDIDATNGDKIAAMTILSMMAAYCFCMEPELYPIICFRMVKISLKHGMSAMSSHAFAIFAIIESAVDDIDGAYRYAMLSLKLLERYATTKTAWLPRVYSNVYGMVAPIKVPVASVNSYLLEAYTVGKASGDLEMSMLSLHFTTINAYVGGLPLDKVEADHQIYVNMMEECKQGTWLALANLLLQFIQNLCGKSDDPLIMPERPTEAHTKGTFQLYTCGVFLYRLILAFHFGDLDYSLDNIKNNGAAEQLLKGSPLLWLQYLYEGMSMIAAARRSEKKKKQKYKRRGRMMLKKLENLSRHCPENFLHSAYLLKAELLDLKGNHRDAMDQYKMAIDQSTKAGVLYAKALACESFGLALLRQGSKPDADTLLKEAIDTYREWGASAIVSFKEKEYGL